MVNLFVLMRLIVITCVLVGLMVIGAIVVGNLLPTTATIGFYKEQESVYIEYMEDVKREFRLPLLESRCFSAYAQTEHYLALYDAGGDAFVPSTARNRENMSVTEAMLWLQC